MTLRLVVFEDEFFDDLAEQLPEERTATGTPSRSDFLTYVVPALHDLLAEDYEGNTAPIVGVERARVMNRATTLVPLVTLMCVEVDDVVHVYAVRLDFAPWSVDPDVPDDD